MQTKLNTTVGHKITQRRAQECKLEHLEIHQKGCSNKWTGHPIAAVGEEQQQELHVLGHGHGYQKKKKTESSMSEKTKAMLTGC